MAQRLSRTTASRTTVRDSGIGLSSGYDDGRWPILPHAPARAAVRHDPLWSTRFLTRA